MLLTMVLRIICLQEYNLPNPEILVILVQPSSGFLESGEERSGRRKEWKKERERKKEMDRDFQRNVVINYEKS